MKFIFLIIFMLFSGTVWAALDEATISTEDKNCAIHYLTKKTKHNWTIKVDAQECKDGWVDGFATVQLYSPRKELTETLSGFFKEGYWTDTFSAPGKVIERTSPEERVQSLSFLLGEDKEANITYIGQLRATQPEERAYGAFQGCPDFRILVVVPQTATFQNPAFQDKIVEQGLKYIRTYCPDPDILALFGATSPTHPEIIFHMQVDTVTGDRTILPLELKEDESISPIELREEKTDILLSVEPEKDTTIVSYTPALPSNPIKVQEQKKERDILSHLQILSKTSKQPVSGRVAVHINQVLLDGTGITDLPETIQLMYHPNIKEGWAVVEGSLSENKMQVLSIQFCEKEWCTDVP